MPAAAATSSAASTSSVVQTSLNLIKNIAGFGALCLPAGIERLSDSGLSSNEALGLGVALLLLFGLLNAWSFLLIGAACVQTGTETYSAAVTATVGPQMARLVTLSSIFICATAAVGCLVVISATLTDVLAFALQTPFEALPRRGLQLLVVLLVLLPLCRLPSLKPLAPASLFGVLGTAATALCIVVRLLDGSYAAEGAYFEDVRWTPAFSAGAAGLATRLPSSYGLAFFLSLLSQAYLAHQNAPLLLLESTADPGGGGTFAPFRRATLLAFGASCVLFLCIGGAGFATFGEASQPLIINNYAHADPLAALARLGIFLTVLFEFPLLERPFRLSVAEVCSNGRPGVNYSDGVKPGTRAEEVLLSVGFITAVSLLDPPLDQLTALGGATGGALLIYVAPALMALKLEVKLRAKLAPDAPYGVAARARTAALGGLLLMGLALGIIGTVCALQPRPADENPPLDSDAPARDGSHATAPQPLLVCTLPARRLPARVADLWAPSEYHMSERGAIYLGGCAANFTSLTLVFGLVRPREFDYVAQHSAARPGAAREHTPLHRPHFRHNLSWVDSLGLTVSLEGQHCDVTIAENAAWAVCPLHPSHLDVADAREHNKVGHRDVVFWHAHPREAAVVRLVLEPAASALRANNGSRAAVWSGQPLFVPPCHRIVWPRLAAWAAAWRAAGFEDVVLHARDARLCAEVVERLPGVSCTPTPSAAGALPDISRATDHPRDYLDQALLNMVGLVQARAARMVAFVDVDERPPAAGGEMDAALAALQAGSQAYASFFFRPSWCSGGCPTSTTAFAEMLRSGRCSTSHLRGGTGNGNATYLLHGGNGNGNGNGNSNATSAHLLHGGVVELRGVEPDLASISPYLAADLASKVIGVPARMTTIRIHTATPAIGSPHAYAACLQHPVPLIERDPQGCRANQTQKSRALRRFRRR